MFYYTSRYEYGSGSSSAATGNTPASISAKISIGESTLSGIVRDNKSHIAGTQYPMYGIKNNVPKDKTPKFKMSHLYALVALEIVNVGDGKADNDDQPITVNSVTFTAPDNIIGDFNVNVTNDKHTFSDPNPVPSSNSKSIALSGLKDTDGKTGITINPRESATLYFAIKPYDASGKEITICINGSEKKVKMPANTKFAEGKITTLKVPIKLSFQKESTDALQFLPIGDNIAKKEVIINGESINAYSLYKEYEPIYEWSWKEFDYVITGYEYTDPQCLPIQGNVKELFNALGAGFYASHWEGRPAAMTLESINLWLPYNGEMVHIANYPPFASGLAESMGLEDWVVSALLPYLIPESDGIMQSEGLIKLNQFIDPSNVTFNGIVSNGATDANPNIFMLDDETIHKKVGRANVENLLSTKFAYKTPLGETLVPTYQGLLDIVNKTPGAAPSKEAIITARAIYGKIMEKLGDKTVTKDLVVTTVTVHVATVFKSIFADEYDMIEKLPNLKIAVKIKNHPAPGQSDCNPIIFWGFDVYNSFDE